MRKFQNLLAISLLLFPLLSKAQWSLTGNAGTNVVSNFLGTTDNKGLVFRTNNIERMRFNSAGNLGLGLTNPTSKFHIIGTATTSLTSAGYIISGDVGGSNLSLDNNELQARNNGAASTLYLNYWGGNIWAGRNVFSPTLYVNGTSAHVGIGSTDDANYLLNVSADDVYGGIVVQNHEALLPSIYLEKTGLGAAMFAEKTDPTSSSYTIQANTIGNGYAMAAFASTGQASGIYTSSENNHGIFADGGGGVGDYAGYFNGSVFTTGLYQSSDANLKKNIRDLPNALQIIQQLKPKIYEYKQEGNYALMDLPKGDRIGFLAQDVEKLLPSLVKDSYFETKNNPVIAKEATNYEAAGKPMPSESIEFKALNYTEMIPLLVKAIQEQQQTINALQQKVDGLESNFAGQSNTSINSNTGLLQNMPNPFSKETVVNISVPTAVKSAVLVISNSAGRIMQQFVLTIGKQTILINGSNWATGPYYCKLIADNITISQSTMLIVR